MIVFAGLVGSAVVYYCIARRSGWPVWGGWGWRIDPLLEFSFLAIATPVLLLNFARLVSAYRHYLKFEHVYPTVIVAHLVVLLAAAALFMNVMIYL